uniref:Uncharacterized protein n=1 Tax=Meloidogyne incognita TaxID=6306 RepID=A0A914LQA3_MELIC
MWPLNFGVDDGLFQLLLLRLAANHRKAVKYTVLSNTINPFSFWRRTSSNKIAFFSFSAGIFFRAHYKILG